MNRIKKILIIEDERETAQITETLLKKRGFETSIAPNGLLGFEMAKRNSPDLIIADALMPGLDGFNFYKKLKTDDETLNIPVLIVSGRSHMEDSFNVVGVEGFMAKPFSPQEMIDKINTIFDTIHAKQSTIRKVAQKATKTVLIIGGKMNVIRKMVEQTEKAGYRIDFAITKSDALAKTIHWDPDIIFIDTVLNGVKAYELTKLLRELPQAEGKPIIGFSFGEAAKQVNKRDLAFIIEINELLKAGATNYIGTYDDYSYVKTLAKFLEPKNLE